MRRGDFSIFTGQNSEDWKESSLVGSLAEAVLVAAAVVAVALVIAAERVAEEEDAAVAVVKRGDAEFD